MLLNPTRFDIQIAFEYMNFPSEVLRAKPWIVNRRRELPMQPMSSSHSRHTIVPFPILPIHLLEVDVCLPPKL